MFKIYSFVYDKFLLAQESVLNSMYRSGPVDTLVTHTTNIEGFDLTPLSRDRRGYMPPLLKTKQKQLFPYLALEM